MTAVIQFGNVHNQQDKGASNDEKRLEADRKRGRGGFILVEGRNCQNEFRCW